MAGYFNLNIKKMKTYSIGKAGNIDITVINEEGIDYIPVKSICEQLDIKYSKVVLMILKESMLIGKWRLVDTSTEKKKSDSVAVDIKWMLGFFFLLIKKSKLSTKESIKTLKEFNMTLMDHITT